MNEKITNLTEESIKAKLSIGYLKKEIVKAAEIIINAYQNKKKVLISGNGGSAADSQHFAAEMVGRFKIDRPPLPCIDLTSGNSIISAIANDYGFENVFARQVEAYGQPGDVYIGISTSGNSQNIIYAIEKAKQKGMKTISLLGKSGGKTKEISDFNIIINSEDTALIQEQHEQILHAIAGIIEANLFR